MSKKKEMSIKKIMNEKSLKERKIKRKNKKILKEIIFEEKRKSYKKIKAKDTFKNSYTNGLWVMLHYMLSNIEDCKNKRMKQNLADDFVKYEQDLESELGYIKTSSK